MKDIFAWLYEDGFGLYDSQFSLIFDSFFDDGGYILLGLTFLIVPLIMWSLFYFAWKNPYGKFWHWMSWMSITITIVGLCTWAIESSNMFGSDNQVLIDAFADPISGYATYAKTLLIKYALANGSLAIIIGVVYSLILKQFSKIQIHLPF